MCKKELILCVDDEENQLAVRKLVLESKGYAVLTAASGQQALGLLAQHQVDLVLSDHLMPGLTGTELARQIKAQMPELPVILISAVNEIPADAAYADLFMIEPGTGQKTGQGTNHPADSAPSQECFLYTLVATMLAWGESDPKLRVSIKISKGLKEPSPFLNCPRSGRITLLLKRVSTAAWVPAIVSPSTRRTHPVLLRLGTSPMTA
jgi:CheY-like chemotaxis protein